MKLRNKRLSYFSIVLALISLILATCTAIMLIWGVDVRISSTLGVLSIPPALVGFSIMFGLGELEL